MLSPRRETRVTVEQPITEAEALAEMDARWAAARAAKVDASAPSDEPGRKARTALGTFAQPDPHYVPATPTELLRLQAMFGLQPAATARQGAMSVGEQAVYVQRAVHEGRFGANIVCRLMKGTMGADMAQSFADELMMAFFEEHAPRTAVERSLVEHACIVHCQLLLTRAKWSGAQHLPDIESLTRVQARLTSEFNRILDALAAQRDGRRVTIANANIAAGTQVIHQEFHTNGLGADRE